MVTPLYQDPFAPVLLSSPPLTVTEEQKTYIKKVLDRSSSDSRFSDKAYVAITKILTGGSVVSPVVTGLTPSTVVLGSPSFDVLVNGSGFTPESVIVFNGFDEPTTFVSATQVKTGVNMPLWLAPATVPILVRSKEGVLSNSMMFSFTSPVTLSAPSHSLKSESVVKDVIKSVESAKPQAK